MGAGVDSKLSSQAVLQSQKRLVNQLLNHPWNGETILEEKGNTKRVTCFGTTTPSFKAIIARGRGTWYLYTQGQHRDRG